MWLTILNEIQKVLTGLIITIVICMKTFTQIPFTSGAVLCWGSGGTAPQTLALPPKYDTKHCLTSATHQHTGAKGALCSLQNTPKCVYGRALPRTPLGGAHEAPHTPQSAGERTSLPYPIALCTSIFPPLALATWGLDGGGRHCPEIFILELRMLPVKM